MRIEEFCKELKKHVYLGEYVSVICFIKINEHFAPAVLQMKLDIKENSITYKYINKIMYWDNNKKTSVSKDIPYEIQSRLGLPIKENIIFDNNTADEISEEDEQKKYYILMEKICCALEVGCVTQSMKKAYIETLKLNDNCKMKDILRYFFPEATEQLFN